MTASENLDSEEIVKELCVCNGLSFEKISQDGPATTTLEMFFSGYPRMVGLSHFPNLTVLTLVGQNIQRIVGLESCHVLQELWIIECQLKRIENLHHCPNLEKLYLYDNKIAVIEALESLNRLQVLWLNDNEIEVIEGLCTLQNLKELNLARNHIHSIGQRLDPNVKLERLNLSGNKISSFKEVTSLARLANLKDLGLKDPQYGPNPVCLLCNYAIHVLYHLPQLQRLDTYDVSPKQIKDLAESTVIKKIMYYNMRVKTIYRRQREELEKLEEETRRMKQVPEDQIKILTFLMKNLEREQSDTQLLVNFQRNIPISNQHDGNQSDIEKSDSQQTEESVRNCANLVEQMCQKTQAVKERITSWTQKLHETQNNHETKVVRITENFDLLVQFLQTELETVGNVRFEEGSPSDSWFKSCYDLILSRFCAVDFKAFGISGVKINRIVRVHNRILRLKFDEKLQDFMDNEELGAPMNSKKKFEYLFYMFDPKFPVEKKELLQVLEDGFKVTKTPQMPEQEQDEAVLLSNSLSFSEGSRLEFSQKQAMANKYNPEFFKYGKIVIAKVFLGRSVPAREKIPIKPLQYVNANSIFRSRKYENSTSGFLYEGICNSKEHGNCNCILRQCEWFVFDPDLVLPEYVIEFEFITTANAPVFSPLSSDNAEHVALELKTDEDIINMEPIIKPRPKIISLDEKTVLSLAKANIYSQITVLNLHGNSLSKLKDISRLNRLQKLILSFNEFSRLDDVSYLHEKQGQATFASPAVWGYNLLVEDDGLGKLNYLALSWNNLTKTGEDISNLHKQAANLLSLDIQFNPWQKPNLEYLDASHNRVISLEGFKGLGKLKYLDLSWNNLTKTGEDISTLHKQAANLLSLDIQFNPWQKPASLRKTVIGRFRSLTHLDGVLITEEEVSEALQFFPGSRITQASLLTNCRTDTVRPRCLSLLPSAQILSQISKNCLDPYAELSSSWYSMITSLDLNKQNLSKLSNLEKLVNLRWASFNDNQLTKIEGLEHCVSLEELSLDGNAITKLEGLSKLTKLRRLSLNSNQLASFDGQVLDTLSHLHFLSAENNNISSLAGLQRASVLIELYLSNNNISNNQEIYYLKGLNNLVILDMYGNPISWKHENYRFFVIFHLPPLKAVDGIAVDPSESENAKDMFGGRLTSDVIAEKIGHQNFTDLQELQWRTSSIRTVDLVPVDQFRNVHTVNLENNNLTSFSGLIFLPNVKTLYLNHNHIESILPRQKSQSHLTNRQILHQKVNSSGYGQQGTSKGGRDPLFGESLTAIMQSLEVLHLGYNGISSVPQLQLGRLRNLKSLFLQGNEISQVEGLEGLQFLRELVLDHNRIKLITENSFSKLNSLVSLHLEENRLRDLNNLLPLIKLKKLLVGFNKIQEISEVEKLEAMPALVELTISGNPISRKMFHRQILVLRLQSLQILDGVPITTDERARAEMYFLEQQALSVPNSVMDMGNPISTISVPKPPPLRVTNISLPGGVPHFVGADISFNNAHDDLFANETNKFKKSKHPILASNPRSTQADIVFRQPRGGSHQTGQNRVQHTHLSCQDNDGRKHSVWDCESRQNVTKTQ